MSTNDITRPALHAYVVGTGEFVPGRGQGGSREAIEFLEELVGPLTIGRAIASHRLREEISQAAFARTLGISRGHLNDIEKGRKGVSPERAMRFAHTLGHSEMQWLELALQDQLARAGLPDMLVSVTPRPKRRKPAAKAKAKRKA